MQCIVSRRLSDAGIDLWAYTKDDHLEEIICRESGNGNGYSGPNGISGGCKGNERKLYSRMSPAFILAAKMGITV